MLTVAASDSDCRDSMAVGSTRILPVQATEDWQDVPNSGAERYGVPTALPYIHAEKENSSCSGIRPNRFSLGRPPRRTQRLPRRPGRGSLPANPGTANRTGPATCVALKVTSTCDGDLLARPSCASESSYMTLATGESRRGNTDKAT